jgi:hypothetical protein
MTKLCRFQVIFTLLAGYPFADGKSVSATTDSLQATNDTLSILEERGGNFIPDNCGYAEAFWNYVDCRYKFGMHEPLSSI